jgi:hypothetical protein
MLNLTLLRLRNTSDEWSSILASLYKKYVLCCIMCSYDRWLPDLYFQARPLFLTSLMLTEDACYNLAGGSLMSPLRTDGRNLDIVGRFIYSYISQWCEGSFFDIMMVTSWMCLACSTNVWILRSNFNIQWTIIDTLTECNTYLAGCHGEPYDQPGVIDPLANVYPLEDHHVEDED